MPAAKQTRIRSRRGTAWRLAELKQLGEAPDSVLARRTGRTIKEVVAMREHRRIAMETGPRRWTARETKMLGRYNDAELSRRLRRTYDDVRHQRLSLHIPSLQPLRIKRWTRAEEKLLGSAPDIEIARRLMRPI